MKTHKELVKNLNLSLEYQRDACFKGDPKGRHRVIVLPSGDIRIELPNLVSVEVARWLRDILIGLELGEGEA